MLWLILCYVYTSTCSCVILLSLGFPARIWRNLHSSVPILGCTSVPWNAEVPPETPPETPYWLFSIDFLSKCCIFGQHLYHPIAHCLKYNNIPIYTYIKTTNINYIQWYIVSLCFIKLEQSLEIMEPLKSKQLWLISPLPPHTHMYQCIQTQLLPPPGVKLPEWCLPCWYSYCMYCMLYWLVLVLVVP
jgi:hypothetical protein